MALCHDERDYAMGFSRRNPVSPYRMKSSRTIEREKERRRYLKALTPYRKRAWERVNFCLAAIGQYLAAKGEMVHIGPRELHEHFPGFAKAMGYRGPLYRLKDGKCPAVDLSFPESKDGVWLLNPYLDYEGVDEDERRPLHTKRAREAALEFCKAWLPGWKWPTLSQ